MGRLFFFAVFIVALLSCTAVLAQELPPMELRRYLSQFPQVVPGPEHRGQTALCTIDKMTLPKMPCVILYDAEREISYVLMAKDGRHISHVIALKDGEPAVVWVATNGDV